MALDSVCFIPPSPSFSVTSHVGRVSSVLFSFNRAPARLLGYFYNDTLCNVNYCRRNELEEVFQDAASPHFSLSFLSRYYPPSLSFSFLLVSGAGMSKGCSLSLSLSRHSRDGYFANLRITAHFHGADLVKGLIRSRLARFAPC